MSQKQWLHKKISYEKENLRPSKAWFFFSFNAIALKKFGLILIALMVLTSTAFGLVNTTSVQAAPTDKATCEAQGGTWAVNPKGTSTEPSCSGAVFALGMSLEQQVQSYIYYRTLGTCLVNGGPNLKDGTLIDGGERIRRDHAQSGDWFGQAQAPGGTYLAGINGVSAKDDGSGVECNQSSLVNNALSLWDNWAPDESLCSMGMRSANDDEFRANRCTNAQGGSDEFKRGDNMLSSFQQAVKNRVYGGNEPTITANSAWLDAGKYLLYLKTFQKVCAPSATISTTAPAGTTNKDYSVRQATKVDGKVGEVTNYYISINNKSQSDGAAISAGNSLSRSSGNDVMSCGNLVKAINGDGGKGGLVDAYKKWLTTSAGTTTDPPSQDCKLSSSCPSTDAKSSCGIQGLGWIVCPLLSFIGDIADNAFSFLASNFLETRVDIINSDGVKAAWSAIRNVANVAFVIAFLVIIFSQLTGQGVSNYGVKKLLPRIVVAAILVNVSFFICQLAIDASNILGYSLNKVIGNTYVQISGNGTGGGDATTNGLGIAAIVVGVLAGTAGIALALTATVLSAAVLALLLIVLILFARTALIVLLVVIAPLAFVAYLLPNTEGWFKKWYKAFFALLVVFPVISVVFGASSLAAKVINDAAEASGDTLMQIVAVGVAALPLFAVPALLQGSLKAAGAVGARLSGASGKFSGKVGAEVKNSSKLGQIQQFRGQQAKIRNAQMLGGTFKGTNRNPLNWGRNLNSAVNNQINQRTGKFGAEQSRLGERINAKIEAEEVTAAKATIGKMGLTPAQITELGRGNTVPLQNGKKIKADIATQKAAISTIIEMKDHDNTRQLIDTVGNSSDTSLRAHLADTLASSPNRPGYVGGAALGAIRTRSGVNTERLAQDAIKSGAYSAEKIATGDDKELAFIHSQLKNVDINDKGRAITIANAQDALSDDVLNKKIGKNAPQITDIAKHP